MSEEEKMRDSSNLRATFEEEQKKALEDAFDAHLGSRWDRRLTVTLRADDWTWLVLMALWGLKQWTKESKQSGRYEKDMSERMSIASFRMSIDSLVTELVKAAENSDKPKHQRKGRKAEE